MYWKRYPDEYERYLLKQREEKLQKAEEEKLAKIKKADLEKKLEILQEQLNKANKENVEFAVCKQQEIQELSKEREKLGIFSGKGKKEIDGKIQDIKDKISNYRIICGLEQIEQAYNKVLNELRYI